MFSFSEWSSHIWVIKRLFQNENIKGPTSLVIKFCSGSMFSLWWQRLHQQVSVGPAFSWTRSNPWRPHRVSDLALIRQGLETPLLCSCLVVSGSTSFRVEPSRNKNVPWILVLIWTRGICRHFACVFYEQFLQSSRARWTGVPLPLVWGMFHISTFYYNKMINVLHFTVSPLNIVDEQCTAEFRKLTH